MNDVARMVSTIVIWSILGTILIALAFTGNDELTPVAMFLVIGAIASTGIVWQHAGKRSQSDADSETRARLKRNEGLAERLVEEDLDDQDIATLEELLDEQRATRRLQDR